EIGPLGSDSWQPERHITDPRLCRANDLDFTLADDGAGALRVTLDRADCTTSLRDLAGGTGRVALIRETTLAIERAGLDFPNGQPRAGSPRRAARGSPGRAGSSRYPAAPTISAFRTGASSPPCIPAC